MQVDLAEKIALLKDCKAELLEQTQQINSLRTEVQQLRKDQSRSGFAAAAASPAAEGSSESEQLSVLRLTGLREENDEDSGSLLAKVAEVLDTLPCEVAPSDAVNQTPENVEQSLSPLPIPVTVIWCSGRSGT